MVEKVARETDHELLDLRSAQQAYLDKPDGYKLYAFESHLGDAIHAVVIAGRNGGDNATFLFHLSADEVWSKDVAFTGPGPDKGTFEVQEPDQSIKFPFAPCLEDLAEHARDALVRRRRNKDSGTKLSKSDENDSVPFLNPYSTFLVNARIPLGETTISEGVAVEIGQRFYCRMIDKKVNEYLLSIPKDCTRTLRTYQVIFRDGSGMVRSQGRVIDFTEAVEAFIANRKKRFIFNPSFALCQKFIEGGIANEIWNMVRASKPMRKEDYEDAQLLFPTPQVKIEPSVESASGKVAAMDCLATLFLTDSASPTEAVTPRDVYCIIRVLSGLSITGVAQELDVANSTISRVVKKLAALSEKQNSVPGVARDSIEMTYLYAGLPKIRLADCVKARMDFGSGRRPPYDAAYRAVMMRHKRVLWGLYQFARKSDASGSCMTTQLEVEAPDGRLETRLTIETGDNEVLLSKYECLSD